jgi:hypothetical protein
MAEKEQPRTKAAAAPSSPPSPSNEGIVPLIPPPIHRHHRPVAINDDEDGIMGGDAIVDSISDLRDEIIFLRSDNVYLRRDVNDLRVRLEDLIRVIDVEGKDGRDGNKEEGRYDEIEEGSLSLGMIEDVVDRR